MAGSGTPSPPVADPLTGHGPCLAVTIAPDGLRVHAATATGRTRDGRLVAVLHPRLGPGLSTRWTDALARAARDPSAAEADLLVVDDGLPWAAAVERLGGGVVVVTGAGQGSGVAHAIGPHGVVVASHAAPVVRRLGARPVVAVDVLSRATSLDPDPGRTPWAGVGFLGAGRALVVDGRPGGGWDEVEWFRLSEKRPSRSRPHLGEQFARVRAALDGATEQMANDGPLAMCCSAGLDSALLATSLEPVARRRGARVTGWTAAPRHGSSASAPPGWLTDETDGARAIARSVGVLDLVTVPTDDRLPWPADPGALFDRLWLPPPNPGNLPWLQAIGARAGRRGATTLFAGLAGNELLSASVPDATWSLVAAGRWGAAARALGERHASEGTGWVRTWRSAVAGPAARRAGLRPHRVSSTAGPVLHDRARLLRLARTPRPYVLMQAALTPGVVLADPTSHPAVLRAVSELTDEAWCAGGPSRPVARALLAGRVEEPVRAQRRRGLQSADQWTWTHPWRDRYGDVVARAAARDDCAAHFDVAGLRAFVDAWPRVDDPPDLAVLQAFDRAVVALAFADWAEALPWNPQPEGS